VADRVVVTAEGAGWGSCGGHSFELTKPSSGTGRMSYPCTGGSLLGGKSVKENPK
jgi:hypothetical protein